MSIIFFFNFIFYFIDSSKNISTYNATNWYTTTLERIMSMVKTLILLRSCWHWRHSIFMSTRVVAFSMAYIFYFTFYPLRNFTMGKIKFNWHVRDKWNLYHSSIIEPILFSSLVFNYVNKCLSLIVFEMTWWQKT